MFKKRMRTLASLAGPAKPKARRAHAAGAVGDVADDPDDAEIRRLEAKLGMRGTTKKRNAQLGRALERVGLGGGLEGLLGSIDDMERRLVTGEPLPARAAAADEDSDDNRPDEVHRNGPLPPADSGASDGSGDASDGDSDGAGSFTSDGEEEASVGDVPTPHGRAQERAVRTDGGAALATAAAPARGPPAAAAAVASGGVVPSSMAWVPASRRGVLKGVVSLSGGAPAAGHAEAVKKRGPQLLYGQDAPAVDVRVREGMKHLNDSNPEYVAIKRRVQGIVNRLSEANLDPLTTELVGVYDTSSKAFVNCALTDTLLSVAGNDTQVLRPLTMVYAALLAALHVRVDSSVSGFVLERIIRRFMELSKLQLSPADPTASSSPSTADAIPLSADGPEGKQANNLLLFLCYLCVFNTVHHNMVFAILDLLVNRLSEWDVEALLLALQHCGSHLRGEEPDRLKTLLARIEADARSGTEKPTVRVEVMLELIQDVRSKRTRQAHQQLVDRGLVLRKWLNRLASRHDQSGIDRRFRATLADVCNIERTGRWWMVGASWAGSRAVPRSTAADGAKGTDNSAAAEGRGRGRKTGVSAGGSASDGDSDSNGDGNGASETDEEAEDEHDVIDELMGTSSSDAALHKLAREQRMNTPAKRDVFVALMGAEDAESAMDRLLKLGLKGSAEREIVRVLVDCAGQESSHNPFYSEVAVKLCTYNGRFKFTFQLVLWDELKGMLEHSTRRVYNLSKLLARLLIKHCLSIAVLKVVEFTSLPKNTLLFLRSCFADVLCVKDTENVRGIFSRAGAGPDKTLVRDGMLIFLHKYMRAHVKCIPASQQELFQSNLKTARRSLESIAREDEFAL